MSPDTQTHLRIQTHIVHVPLFLSTYQISGEINALLNFPFTDVNTPTMALVYIQSIIDLLVNAHGISPSLVPDFFVSIQTTDAHPNADSKIVIIGCSNHTEEKHTRKKETQTKHKHGHLETVSHTQERTHTTNNIPMTLQILWLPPEISHDNQLWDPRQLNHHIHPESHIILTSDQYLNPCWQSNEMSLLKLVAHSIPNLLSPIDIQITSITFCNCFKIGSNCWILLVYREIQWQQVHTQMCL